MRYSIYSRLIGLYVSELSFLQPGHPILTPNIARVVSVRSRSIEMESLVMGQQQTLCSSKPESSVKWDVFIQGAYLQCMLALHSLLVSYYCY